MPKRCLLLVQMKAIIGGSGEVSKLASVNLVIVSCVATIREREPLTPTPHRSGAALSLTREHRISELTSVVTRIVMKALGGVTAMHTNQKPTLAGLTNWFNESRKIFGI